MVGVVAAAGIRAVTRPGHGAGPISARDTSTNCPDRSDS